MDTNAVVASAAVGAVVATVTSLAIDRLRKFKDNKEHELALVQAEKDGHLKGWFEGRESILQNLSPQVAMAEPFTGE